MPLLMSTPGSKATAAGITVMLLSVSTGIHFDGFGLLLCFAGVLVGTSLVAAGVRMGDRPARNPIVPVVFARARALAAFMRRNNAAVGLIIASCAFTVLEDPVLCFAMFALLQIGVSLIKIGARGG